MSQPSQQIQGLLEKAEAQMRSGKHKAAVSTLLYVEVQMRGGEKEAARSLLDLAQELRDMTQGGVRDECDLLIESANKVLDRDALLRERLGDHAVGFAPALYLGVYPNLRTKSDGHDAGVLWFASQWIGIGSQEGEPRQGAFLPMHLVASVEITGGRVTKSAGELLVTYAVLGVPGLVIGGAEDYRTEVVVHAQTGGSVHFIVNDQEPTTLRDAVAPLLNAVSVPFADELTSQATPSPIAMPEQDSAAVSPTDQRDPSQVPLIEALERLASLHAQGSLTDEEFAAFKAKLAT